MATGSGARQSGLTLRQQERIEQALERIREENGLDVSVLVGDLELTSLDQFRAAAEKLHAALGEERSPTAVLVVVAPGQRRLEVVTGPGIRRRVPDRVCALAVLSMTSAFGGGDLSGGIVDGLRQIADAAGKRSELSPADAKSAQLAVRADALGGHNAPAHGAGAAH
ncbi:MAG: uncharacterized protein JWM64_1242 [Frankiales bacterium]|nr:uncharacterized protein [Frankiales bacterium]